jgi:hypothetical protein
MMFWQKIVRKFSLNRVDKLNCHYLALQSSAKILPRDKEEFSFFSAVFARYHKSAVRMSNLRLVCYALLYPAVLVSTLKLIPFFNFLVRFIEVGNALLGTTLLIIAIFILNARVNLNLTIMQDCLAHMTAMYHGSSKRDGKTLRAALEKAW